MQMFHLSIAQSLNFHQRVIFAVKKNPGVP